MAARTRLALVTVIILVGCVFAIPHFRHPTGDSAKSDSKTDEKKDVTDLTLKIAPGDKKTDKKVAKPIALRDVDSLNNNSVFVQHPVTPPASVKEEEWKFPPIAKLGESQSGNESRDVAKDMRSLEPVPANSGDTGTRQVGLSPIRLLGDNIGQRVTSSNFDQIDGRRAVTQRFESSAGGPPKKLIPQALQNQQRFASQRMTKPTSLQTDRVEDDDANWHKVVNGDTLEKLSQQYYGSPEQALMIFEANRQALFNPAILPIGLDLKLPALDVARTSNQVTANRTTTGLRPLTPQPVRPVSLP